MTDEHPTEANNPIAATIDASEVVRDPLEGLIEKTATDPGAAFQPAVLERLVALKKDDRAAFEVLRAELKSAGCRMTALDDAIKEENGDTGGGHKPSQADVLIALAQSAELFHAPDGTGFADLDISGHRETWPIRSKGFRKWLARCFYEATGGAPSSEALQSALNVIEARAHFDAPELAVHVRVGGLNDRLYLDLGDQSWRAVEIDATGWRIIDSPPVRFRRAAGMQPLPMPMSGGSVEKLRSFLNVKTDADFVLAVSWLLAAFRDCGPYPVLVLSGEQGSAKSTFSAAVRALMATRTEWTGTASRLLGVLSEAVDERAAKSKTWPDSPRALSGRLRRAATFLRKIGIEVAFKKVGRAHTRIIEITASSPSVPPERPGVQRSVPSASAALMPKPNLANGFAAQSPRTVAQDADGSRNGNAPTVRTNLLKNNAGNGADGMDAKIPPQSELGNAGATGWSGRI
jgi:hypothetical protein